MLFLCFLAKKYAGENLGIFRFFCIVMLYYSKKSNCICLKVDKNDVFFIEL